MKFMYYDSIKFALVASLHGKWKRLLLQISFLK